MKTKVDVRGLFDITFFEEGSGQPLVFLHGIDGLPAFPSWLEPFAQNHRVIAPQLPGVGESTGLEHLDDFSDLAVLYLDLFDAMGLERIVLMGQDLGGNIAAEVAARCSHGTEKLILLAPTGLWDDDNPVPDVFATPRPKLLEYTWHDPEDAQARGLVPERPADEEAMRTAMLERNKTLTAAAKFLWPIPERGLSRRMHRIDVPTLLVWGASDGIVPPVYAKMFQDAIRGASLCVIENAAHMPMLERPDEFRAAVEGFLAG